MTIVALDADVLRYQLAFSNTKRVQWDEDSPVSEVVNPEKAKTDLQDYIADLLQTLGAEDFLLPLSVSSNFRKEFYPAYKANRANKPKPALWGAIDGFLHELWPEKIIKRERLEGDDILGLLATHPCPRLARGHKLIVASIDKDMGTLPCRWYNPGKPDNGVRTISQHDADLFWMKQVLMGDSADNYPGLPQFGPKKTDALLNPIHEQYLDADPEDHLMALWWAVVAAYKVKGLTEEDAITQARLARILRHGDYNFKTEEVTLWTP